MSDINSIAIQLGVSPHELAIERFKVDRQKLENMIKGICTTSFKCPLPICAIRAHTFSLKIIHRFQLI